MAFIKLPEGTAPSTPATGTVVAYAKDDGFLYSKDDAGTETMLGGTGTALSLAGGNMAGGINSARGNITQHATTMDFFAVTSPDILDGTGSAVTITACVNAPQAGATRKFYPIVDTVLTHGATFDIAGNASLTAAAGDCWIIEAKTVSTYRVTAVKEDGTAVVGLVNAYVLVRDEKTANTAGGTFTSGAWQTRDINTEVTDTAGICSISSNQITLAAGTYEVDISAPASSCDRHKTRLQNITDATTTIAGTSEFSAGTNYGSTSSLITGRFTIAAQKTFEVQHQCQTTKASDGFGVAANFGVAEVYTVAKFVRVSA